MLRVFEHGTYLFDLQGKRFTRLGRAAGPLPRRLDEQHAGGAAHRVSRVEGAGRTTGYYPGRAHLAVSDAPAVHWASVQGQGTHHLGRPDDLPLSQCRAAENDPRSCQRRPRRSTRPTSASSARAPGVPVAARELAEAGRSVIVVEDGPSAATARSARSRMCTAALCRSGSAHGGGLDGGDLARRRGRRLDSHQLVRLRTHTADPRRLGEALRPRRPAPDAFHALSNWSKRWRTSTRCCRGT